LKPGNILLSSDGAKISDFGLARAIHSARGGLEHSQAETRRSLGSGTLAYMAPEQREGNLGDFRSDTFGLGLVLAKAITGRLPEPGDTLADLMRDPPAWASRLFERCHSRYERRFPSAVEALAVLLEETDKRRQLPKLVPLSGPPDPVRAGAQPLAPASVPPLAPPVQANPWRSGNVAVPFVLTNPQGLPADVHIRVSCDDGATWREATTITGTRSLRATLSGEPHTVLWNSVSDTGRRAVTVLVRVDVDGEKGTWVHTYHVDNRSAPEQTAERPSLWRLMWGRST
jgi:serine/threonine protein kinase